MASTTLRSRPPSAAIAELAAPFRVDADHSHWPEVELPGWRVLRPLSAGAQAFTYLVKPEAEAHAKTPSIAVAKVYRAHGWEGYPFDGREQRWRAVRESMALTVLQRARCPNVPPPLDFGLCTAHAEQPWIILPFYRGGPLRWFHGERHHYAPELNGDLARILEITGAIAAALDTMHQHPMRIVHRDLNLGNVFLSEPGGEVILGDFGAVQLRGFPPPPGGEGAIPSGIRGWRPPELVEDPEMAPTPAFDLYQLGGLAYEALTGGRILLPGESPSFDEEFRTRYPADPRLSLLKALCVELLAENPAERPAPGEVVQRIGEIEGIGGAPAIS